LVGAFVGIVGEFVGNFIGEFVGIVGNNVGEFVGLSVHAKIVLYLYDEFVDISFDIL